MILKINMFGALALMLSDKISDCLVIIRDKAKTLTVDPKKLDDFIIYFEKTWITTWPPKIWNYWDHIGRRTTNDLENFNKHANSHFCSKDPSIFKFIDFLKTVDNSMTMAAIHYRENPTVTVKRCTKTVQAAKADLDNKTAYLANEISLADYLYAQASNIVFIPYLDQETLDENALIDAQLNLNLDSNDGFQDIEEEEEDEDEHS